ncbi:hypothetical protein CAEBREN_31767 [Caenorhabditis brenneri]|uniref:Uncharacterized protein n=1 Tax=Caenorhabditis brenneri TaxID=135651 RepID=G0MI75_CAEBE|nr:hypothetical protein CAEBREN_31767 [Caenorhabditis brenneri]
MADNLLSSQNYINWTMLNKFYGKPQMSTPDDPVIHSPPSIGAAPGMNGMIHFSFFARRLFTNMVLDVGHQMMGTWIIVKKVGGVKKLVEFVGDHATGYNFNVITCESCKAFFRRNALRPKEFKCPYSEDCEINSVSRRFCQKCRLRKCFTVGMKKEWILNEEQLRRRKNSRLNNNSTSNKRSQSGHQMSPPGPQQQPHQSPIQHPGVPVYQQPQRPLTINPMDNQMIHHMQANRQNIMPPNLMSPPGGQPYQLTSPVGSSASDSPPNRSLTMMHNGEKSPDGYDPNMMAHRISQTSLNSRPKMDANGQVVLSTEEYKSLLARIPGGQTPGLMNEEEPINKRAAYNCNGHPMPAEHTPPYSAPMSDMSLSRNNSTSSGMQPLTHVNGTHPNMSEFVGSSAPTQQHFDTPLFGMGILTATGGDVGNVGPDPEMFRKMNHFYEHVIQSALDSPENQEPRPLEAMIPKPEYMTPQHSGFQYHADPYGVPIPPPLPEQPNNVNYQLNAAELKALDTVREAFFGIDDPMEQGRQMQSFLKANKSPADIMNIMDVTMRRFVKVAKGVPAFRDVSQEGKFCLLKGGMIEMLTVRGVTRYDPSTNSFKTPTIKGQNVSVNVDDMFAKLNSNAQAQKAKCLEFFGFFDEEIKRNELAVYLVMLAVLFSVRVDPPMSENDARIVGEQHNHFMSLLNRYLESLYGEQARRIFERLPKALGMLNDIARNAGMLFMGTVRSGEAEELPGEFFKIK